MEGGTFSLIELYELFVQFEPSSIVQKFHEELEELILELNKEDWELSKHTQVLCNEYGRRRLKEMIMKLQVHKER